MNCVLIAEKLRNFECYDKEFLSNFVEKNNCDVIINIEIGKDNDVDEIHKYMKDIFGNRLKYFIYDQNELNDFKLNTWNIDPIIFQFYRLFNLYCYFEEEIESGNYKNIIKLRLDSTMSSVPDINQDYLLQIFCLETKMKYADCFFVINSSISKKFIRGLWKFVDIRYIPTKNIDTKLCFFNIYSPETILELVVADLVKDNKQIRNLYNEVNFFLIKNTGLMELPFSTFNKNILN